MPEETRPHTKEEFRTGMKVFFGEHGDKGIGLDEDPKKEGDKTAPPTDGKKEGEQPPAKDGEQAPPKEGEQQPPAPAPAKSPAQPKKVAKKQPAAPTPSPRVDDDTIQRVASETAARTAAAMQKQPDAPKPADIQLEGLDLDAKEKRTIEKMQLAGRTDPKFADLAERTLKFWKAEKDYVDAWRAKHQGEEFKIEDHAEFYAKHEPQFDQDEFDDTVKKAEHDEIRRVSREEGKAAASAETNKLRFETRWKDEAPEIDKVANETVAELIEEVDPELAKLLNVDNETVISPETLGKIEQKDRIVGKVLTRESGLLARMVREVERLDRYPDHYRGDPQNQLHVMIFNAALDLEEEIASLPKEDQVHSDDDSRTFIRQREFNQRASAIDDDNKLSVADKKKAIAELEAKHWTLESSDVKSAVKSMVLKRVKSKIEEYREVAGNPAPGTAAPPTPTPAPSPAPQPPAARPKPPSTSGGAGDKTSTTPPSNSPTVETQKQTDAAFFA